MESGNDRVWFITGASSGLGRALANAVLDRGERVVATARDPGRLAELADRDRDRVVVASLDVTDAGQARSAVDAGLRAFGRIDVVVNNAGYGLFGALEELPEYELRQAFETNVFGALSVIRAALPQLRRQRSGHVVQISSLEGVAPAVAGEAAYAGTKFAVEGVAEALAKDVEHLGIRVTIVEPGPLRTDFGSSAVALPPRSADYADSVGKALEWFEGIAGKQPNDPDRVAAAIVEAVEADEPPLRLVLGEEAVSRRLGRPPRGPARLSAQLRLTRRAPRDREDPASARQRASSRSGRRASRPVPGALRAT
jgi:NAD(P)-dependent dehydrogenase (short-subunit alcohol dehydrogenase family)